MTLTGFFPKTIFWVLALAAFGCSLQRGAYRTSPDPSFESFFEKARFIMTDQELRLYKELDDQALRERFIRDFWMIRDFDPETEKDAARKEFERRVQYAAIRFSWNSPKSRPLSDKLRASDRGWDTDMGRTYIVLGPPDWVMFGDGSMLPREQFEGDFGWRYKHQKGWETWLYDKHRLAVSFVDTNFPSVMIKVPPALTNSAGDPLHPSLETESGGVALAGAGYPARLTDVLDSVKINYINPKYLAAVQNPLRFKADVIDGKIVIHIPGTTAYFSEEDLSLHLLYRVKIDVSRGGSRLTTILEERNAVAAAENAGAKKSFRIEIPYAPDRKGNYGFDILLEDLTSPILRVAKSEVKARL
jgi:GWxTD domain-containing protein